MSSLIKYIHDWLWAVANYRCSIKGLYYQKGMQQSWQLLHGFTPAHIFAHCIYLYSIVHVVCLRPYVLRLSHDCVTTITYTLFVLWVIRHFALLFKSDTHSLSKHLVCIESLEMWSFYTRILHGCDTTQVGYI